MKKTYSERIPFGSETRLNLGFGPVCPGCDAPRGSHHRPGCPAEECAKCGGVLINCYCMAIQPFDGLRIVRGIVANVGSLDEALALGRGVGNRDIERWSYSDQAAMQYFMEHGPERLRTAVNDKFHECFPGLQPAGVDAKGQKYYSARDLAREVGANEKEFAEFAVAFAMDTNGDDFEPDVTATIQ